MIISIFIKEKAGTLVSAFIVILIFYYQNFNLHFLFLSFLESLYSFHNFPCLEKASVSHGLVLYSLVLSYSLPSHVTFLWSWLITNLPSWYCFKCHNSWHKTNPVRHPGLIHKI